LGKLKLLKSFFACVGVGVDVPFFELRVPLEKASIAAATFRSLSDKKSGTLI
jgi:hypothetical protein